MDFYGLKVKIFNRNVKYARISVNEKRIKMVLPRGVDPSIILERNKKWILKQKKLMQEAVNTARELKICPKSRDELKSLVRANVSRFSYRYRVSVGRITVRKMIRKWGSCSSKKNITINEYLRYLPNELVEYVVFHELLHLIEPAHSKRFYKLLKNEFSSYIELDKKLTAYWIVLKSRALVVRKKQNFKNRSVEKEKKEK